MVENSRVGKLDEIFEQGRSELLNRIAQISVLYEDLRLETAFLNKQVQLRRSPEEIQNPFDIFYFIRRSLVSLLEFDGALNELTRSKEFKRQKITLSKKDAQYIQNATRYFQSNHKLLRRLRNGFGGHFQLSYAAGATANFEPEEPGTVSWEGAHDHWSLKLSFAANVITAGLKHMHPGQNWLAHHLAALEVIGKAYNHAQGATYALIHAFLWDRFT